VFVAKDGVNEGISVGLDVGGSDDVASGELEGLVVGLEENEGRADGFVEGFRLGDVEGLDVGA